jgi:hypothetical protein
MHLKCPYQSSANSIKNKKLNSELKFKSVLLFQLLSGFIMIQVQKSKCGTIFVTVFLNKGIIY